MAFLSSPFPPFSFLFPLSLFSFIFSIISLISVLCLSLFFRIFLLSKFSFSLFLISLACSFHSFFFVFSLFISFPLSISCLFFFLLVTLSIPPPPPPPLRFCSAYFCFFAICAGAQKVGRKRSRGSCRRWARPPQRLGHGRRHNQREGAAVRCERAETVNCPGDERPRRELGGERVLHRGEGLQPARREGVVAWPVCLLGRGEMAPYEYLASPTRYFMYLGEADIILKGGTAVSPLPCMPR